MGKISLLRLGKMVDPDGILVSDAISTSGQRVKFIQSVPIVGGII